jgi:hypothetical protein
MFGIIVTFFFQKLFLSKRHQINAFKILWFLYADVKN